jgi:tetratricopeptide (TPR) repeat protein
MLRRRGFREVDSEEGPVIREFERAVSSALSSSVSSPISDPDKEYIKVKQWLDHISYLIQRGGEQNLTRAIMVLQEKSFDIEDFYLRVEESYLFGLAWYYLGAHTGSVADFMSSLNYFEVLLDQIKNQAGFDKIRKNTYLHLGYANMQLKDPDTSVRWFKKAIAEYGNDKKAVIEANLRIAEVSEGVPSLRKERITALLEVGIFLLMSDDLDLFPRAYKYFEKAKNEHPDISEPYYYLGILWHRIAQMPSGLREILHTLEAIEDSYFPEEKKDLLRWAKEFIEKAKRLSANKELYIHPDSKIYEKMLEDILALINLEINASSSSLPTSAASPMIKGDKKSQISIV